MSSLPGQNRTMKTANEAVSDAIKRMEKQKKIESAMKDIIKALGLNINDQHLRDTPERVARMYVSELFTGLTTDRPNIRVFENDDGYDQMISLKFGFTSMCSHHWLPFNGTAIVAYIPKKKIVGVSKLSRIFDIYAKRPTLQERIVEEVTQFIEKELQPEGCGCSIKAAHDCMRIRGVKKENSQMKTTALRGCFERPDVKQEFLELWRE